MAYMNVGDYVYRRSSPVQMGKIINLKTITKQGHSRQYDEEHATVQWINGEISDINTLYLSKYMALIADHEKKLATHRTRLELFNQKFPDLCVE